MGLIAFFPLERARAGAPLWGPESPFVDWTGLGMTAKFCADWNPEFGFLGGQCCGRKPASRRPRGVVCSPESSRESFCHEALPEHFEYIDDVRSGRIDDVLRHLERSIDGRRRGRFVQARCGTSDGFLFAGRPVVGTQRNRLKIRRPGRCVNFGTDRMAAMLEWTGLKLDERYPKDSEYTGVHLLVGDISRPRGQCLAGKGGRKGHVSHKNGLDVDVGFLHTPRGGESPDYFDPKFDVENNLWLVKTLASNPYACVRKIFLSQKLINKLASHARGDPEWPRIAPLLRHVRNHRNHLHVRIWDRAGPFPCDDAGRSEDVGAGEDADNTED